MKHKIIKIMTLSLLLILILFLSGCNISSRSSRDNVPDANYHTGTQGVVLDFLENSPPNKIYNNDPLDVMIEVTNRGASNIVNGRLYVSGFDKKYINIIPNDQSFTIEGKSIYNPDGRLNKILTFTDSRASIPSEADSVEQNIKITACYNYETVLFTSVCIDPNPRTVTEKVCRPETISLSGGQGAPIAVTSIEEESARDRVTFKINFANQGGGTVFDPHKGLTNCHTSLEYDDVDIVDVRVKLSDKSLNCEPNRGQDVRLMNGKGFVYCYHAGNLGNDAYSTQLNVEIDYAYRDTLSKTVEIVNI